MPGPVSDSLDRSDPQVLTCAFCGQEYPPGTPSSQHKLLLEHVLVCADHPMREVERKLASVQNDIERMAKDTERMDWLDANATYAINHAGKGVGVIRWRRGHTERIDARSIIDKARGVA